jgi:hypothetical protein
VTDKPVFEPELDGFEAFRSFQPLFEPDPRYLVLLHLPGSPTIFDELEAALACSRDRSAELCALFAHRNWRCHLVAAAALLLVGDDAPALEALWATLDAGTWAAPQVVAAAYLLDADFEARARKRLLASGGFPKVIAALGALYRRLSSPKLAVLARLDDPQLTKSPEGKDGAHYAAQWLDRLLEVSDPVRQARWRRAPPRAGADTPP